MRIRILKRPPLGVVYDVKPGAEFEVVELKMLGEMIDGYYIIVSPLNKRVLVLRHEAEAIQEGPEEQVAR